MKPTKKHPYLKKIRKTLKAMTAQIKCVIGCDENGAFTVIKNA